MNTMPAKTQERKTQERKAQERKTQERKAQERKAQERQERGPTTCARENRKTTLLTRPWINPIADNRTSLPRNCFNTEKISKALRSTFSHT